MYFLRHFRHTLHAMPFGRCIGNCVVNSSFLSDLFSFVSFLLAEKTIIKNNRTAAYFPSPFQSVFVELSPPEESVSMDSETSISVSLPLVNHLLSLALALDGALSLHLGPSASLTSLVIDGCHYVCAFVSPELGIEEICRNNNNQENTKHQ